MSGENTKNFEKLIFNFLRNAEQHESLWKPWNLKQVDERMFEDVWKLDVMNCYFTDLTTSTNAYKFNRGESGFHKQVVALLVKSFASGSRQEAS